MDAQGRLDIIIKMMLFGFSVFVDISVQCPAFPSLSHSAALESRTEASDKWNQKWQLPIITLPKACIPTTTNVELPGT